MAQSISDMSVTWPDGSTYNGIKLNVNDAGPSSASSLLMDLQVGSASRFNVDKTGTVKLRNSGTITWTDASNLTFSSGDGFQRVRAYSLWATSLAAGLGDAGVSGGATVQLSNTGTLGWTSGANINAPTYDVFLTRDDVGVLAQRRTTVGGTTYPQAFRIYNAYTDATNTFERGKIAWESDVFRIGTEKGLVAGVARAMEFQTNGATRLTLAATAPVFNFNQDSWVIFTGRASFDAPAAGVFRFLNAAGTDAPRVQFGGITSAFPALKRSSTTLQVRLADDSANAPIESASVKTDAPAGGTSGTWKLGVAATVSPTSPDRTIEVDIGGTIYYIAAKTTND